MLLCRLPNDLAADKLRHRGWFCQSVRPLAPSRTYSASRARMFT